MSFEGVRRVRIPTPIRATEARLDFSQHQALIISIETQLNQSPSRVIQALSSKAPNHATRAISHGNELKSGSESMVLFN